EGDLANGNVPWSDPPSTDFLKANSYLMLDTRHFDHDFTDRLLAALSEEGPLDEQMDGLLVHGENFQALNLLQARYHGQVQCIYIDPPYNAKSSEIIYKNTYRDSSWISLIENRLAEARNLESAQAVVVIAIDEVEQEYLGCLLNVVFADKAKTCVTVVHNATGQQGKNFSSTHEYAYFLYPINGQSIGLQERADDPDIRPLRDVSKGEHLRTDAANCFYPILVLDGEIIGFGEVCPDDFHPEGINVVREDGIVEVYPIDPSGTERKWVFARQSVEDIRAELFAEQDAETGEWDIIREKTHFNYKTVWTGKLYSANSWGSRVLNNTLKDNKFSYPKSVHTVRDCIDAALNNESSGTVLDYFAGSGTTGHVVINLNREDGGQRKYVLVEIGYYFDTVLLPRIKKAVYSPDWKDGKPVSRKKDGKPVSCKGVTQLFKYIRLESYEDTMDSLEVTPPSEAQQNLLADNHALAEDYRLRYALGVETAGSACLLGKVFADPFSYTLSVVRDGVRREVQIDLPETFNYLIGLRVAFHQRIDGVLAIKGTDPEGRNCLILWRNLDETDYAALDAWFDRNREQVTEPLDVIYTNGDHTLNAMQQPGENWTAKTIEPIFRELMFGETSDEQ
ncbi:MAG: DNA methyltransferase, partial [Chloroflexi bacterium]|nr:DNA methyltransferase [Chloroflexota bacterium]